MKGASLKFIMEMITLLGLTAGTLTTLSFIPQVIKIWKSKSAHDISFGMFIMFSLGILLWVIYGVLIESPPLVIANAVTLVLAIAILLLKRHYRNSGG